MTSRSTRSARTEGGRVQLTHNNGWDTQPSYSPDGNKIVYTRHDGSDFELYTINVRTGGRVQLTNNSTDEQSPDYSPDGEKIVYVAADGLSQNGAATIYTMNADGGVRLKKLPAVIRTAWPLSVGLLGEFVRSGTSSLLPLFTEVRKERCSRKV
jgi:dipeptidyl aminopeptidase/acylaminoacyl peptidase